MKITMLGTGNAAVTECYNTCYILEDQGKCLLVDAGGGNRFMEQLKRSGYRWQELTDVFVTHKHVDHLLGMFWFLRWSTAAMAGGHYHKEIRIYGHEEVIRILYEFALQLFPKKQTDFLQVEMTFPAGAAGDGSIKSEGADENKTPLVRLIEVTDGQTVSIIGHDVTFFDIGSTKARQFGYCISLADGSRLTCCGDETMTPAGEPYVRGSKWLLHEAFCLEAEADIFKPRQKMHSSVKAACQIAESCGVQKLLLYHTEESHLAERKCLYIREGKQYFSGELYVPDDLETVIIE